MKKLLLVGTLSFLYLPTFAQTTFEEDQLGAWYMYFYQKKLGNGPWGIQGDFQFRNWNVFGDLEQLLLRSGVTYRPENAGVMFTLGYANITTGTFGESDDTSGENRIYQEALTSQKLGNRFFLTHRFRSEQRWVEDQDFRTRYRYNVFLNIPLNRTELVKSAVYIALYNEIFINGQTNIGDGREVQYFDRNRTYLGLGYGLSSTLRTQLGWMNQTTANWQKGQLQVSLHHNF